MTSVVGGMPEKKPGPAYTSPSYTSPMPSYTTPPIQVTGVVYEGHTTMQSVPYHHHHHHCPPVHEAPVCHAPAPVSSPWNSTGYILVLFILLVIITRGVWV